MQIEFDSTPSDIDFNEDFEVTIKKCLKHNQEMRNYYFDMVQKSNDALNPLIKRVFNYHNDLKEYQLLGRQLKQYKAVYKTFLSMPYRGGCVIDGKENIYIKIGYDKAVEHLNSKIELIETWIDVVNSSIDKVKDVQTTHDFKNEIFEPKLIVKIHENLNGVLFVNTFDELRTALNNPESEIVRLKLIATNNDRIYNFIYELSNKAKIKGFANFDIIFCKNYGFDFDTYKKKKVSFDGKNGNGFKKLLYETFK